MKRFSQLLTLTLLGSLLLGGCNTPPDPTPQEPQEPEGYVEKEPVEIDFANATWAYIGDDIDEELSDAWLVKFYTDMEIDEGGNPIGPGCVVQLLLNVTYNPSQVADATYLTGIYTPQTSSSDFNPGTFIDGYIYNLSLPGGSMEIADGSFYADLAEGSTTMNYDLVDDGAVQISGSGDHFVVEGILLGDKCYKRRFIWSGKIEPTSYVEPSIPNSSIEGDMHLEEFTQLTLIDRGDSFRLRDESYRMFSAMLGVEGVDISANYPAGTGEILRLDLLVPWSWSVADGLPAGTYPMVSRLENTAIDRKDIVPFRAIPGLPDTFSYPYWSGSWYIDFLEGAWGERYARIDTGEVVVERTEAGGHIISATLGDSSEPAHTIVLSADIETFRTI